MLQVSESRKCSADLDVETISRAVHQYLEAKRKAQRKRHIMLTSKLLVIVDMLVKLSIFGLAHNFIAVRVAGFLAVFPLTCWYGMALKKPMMMLPQLIHNVVIAICMDGLLLCVVFNVKDLDQHLKDLAPRSFWLPVAAFGCLVVHTIEYVTRMSYNNMEREADNTLRPEETLELREYVSSAIEDNLRQENTRPNNNNGQVNLMPEHPPVYSSRAEDDQIYPELFTV